ncbi:unnamed protein product [Prunus armeniaca]
MAGAGKGKCGGLTRPVLLELVVGVERNPLLKSADRAAQNAEILGSSWYISSQVFDQYKNWNSKSALASWLDYMQEVYFFKEKTDCNSTPEDLLRFIRNLFHHFSQVHCRPTVTFDEVDYDIRYFFEGFVDVIY